MPAVPGTTGIYTRALKNGDTVYDVTATVNRRQLTGVATTLEKARRLKRTLERELEGGAPTKHRRMTLSDLIEKHWWPAKMPDLRSPNSKPSYNSWKNRIIADLGPTALSKLTVQEVGRWKTDLQLAYSPSMARSVFSTLREVLRWAVEHEYTARNVSMAVKRPRTERRHVPPLPIATVQGILEQAQEQGGPAYLMCWFAIRVGLRLSEITGMTWDEIDFAEARVNLSRLNFSGDDREIKSQAGERPFKLTSQAVTMLQDHRLAQMADYREKGAPPPRHVVLRPDGRTVDGAWWWWRWNAIRTAVGLPKLRFHDLRHVNANLQRRAKVHPRVTQALMGHAGREQTYDYMDVDDGELLEAAEAIERLLEG